MMVKYVTKKLVSTFLNDHLEEIFIRTVLRAIQQATRLTGSALTCQFIDSSVVDLGY